MPDATAPQAHLEAVIQAAMDKWMAVTGTPGREIIATAVTEGGWVHPDDSAAVAPAVAPRAVEAEAVNRYLAGSGSTYLTLPRALMQSMPDDWQSKLVDLLTELDSCYLHLNRADAYEVRPMRSVMVSDISEDDRDALGIEPSGDGVHFRDDAGRQLEARERILTLTTDPIPHFDHGRTFLAPRPFDSGAPSANPEWAAPVGLLGADALSPQPEYEVVSIRVARPVAAAPAPKVDELASPVEARVEPVAVEQRKSLWPFRPKTPHLTPAA